MARSNSSNDPSVIEMALVGYQLQRDKIDEKIRELRGRLGRAGRSRGAARKATATKRRPLSAAARKRISAAQRRRWAAHRKKAAQAAKAQG